MADLVDRARAAVSERAELPGMTLLEHLEELRKRIIRAAIYLVLGFFVAYGLHERIYGYMEKPIIFALQRHHLPTQLNYHNPIDGFNLYLKISFMAGCILASPFVLYEVWKFISPGLYQHEKRYVTPFMISTVGLFLAGAYFGYHWVFPGSLDFLFTFNKDFNPLIEINEYTDLFLTVILGLGITFELPILVMFLALFGIVNAKFLLKNIRYAVLIIFIIAAIITPTPDVLTMCVFATPMLVLYLISIGVAYMVHPARRKRKAGAA
ncbi:twin-arginine translocase subunit TatC [Pseudacidobacterium ailaaui]|jgi:sec-independent protein translocase protein TatC|uniref:twin-arginine translocase subunit TatC n=1 Tax=Pseudacidobacterium ailaaui TaxID=1382359 RepID=UPI00047D5E70|nr:twin-arginine translocase subunit TatC [Pseudacidobacterium ailaaui]MBX6360328.1 twin-arginine translocase subunit TatC [Pseudacidobacterium ailaaui]MDI3254482.1 twin-arginine translocase subunit TatC [Bacillota bacterium]